mgnify:CR=1 FL=1|jgi:hypothetical protein
MGHCLFLRKGEVHTAPVTGVLASSLAVGSTVKLMEGGTAVEYLVVNQGIPENSSLYDASCDGTWLLRKDIHSNRQWHTSNVNKYETSAINTWLNGDFFNSLGSVEQATIKQVKIPYRHGGGSGGTDQSGANGLSCKVFLLSSPEVGLAGASYMPNDGAKLDYFNANTGADSKRIAYLNGSSAEWRLRSPYTAATNNVCLVSRGGGYTQTNAALSYGIRPALILPGNALFDETTMLLKGVK